MKYNLYALLVIILAVSCENSDILPDLPECVQNLIDVIKDEPVRNPPVMVWEWNTDDTTYYYITSDCCDQFNYLYTTNCEIVCAPDGGITGAGDGKCPEFRDIEKTLVWEDKRD
ncbi:MAG: hypothetical protein KJP00_09665 [Bacteroidia bacterium]|nr:hypothetical protein [Bacteroidia bacterium]